MAELVELLQDTVRFIKKLIIRGLILYTILLFVVFRNWVTINPGLNKQKIANDLVELKRKIEELAKGKETNVLPYEDYEYKDGNYRNNNYDFVKHRLQKGETLYRLERLYGTDAKVIRRVNHIDNVRHLKPGQIIIVPVKKAVG